MPDEGWLDRQGSDQPFHQLRRLSAPRVRRRPAGLALLEESSSGAGGVIDRRPRGRVPRRLAPEERGRDLTAHADARERVAQGVASPVERRASRRRVRERGAEPYGEARRRRADPLDDAVMVEHVLAREGLRRIPARAPYAEPGALEPLEGPAPQPPHRDARARGGRDGVSDEPHQVRGAPPPEDPPVERSSASPDG